MDAVWWILSVAMIGVGIAGTVLPALPGTALVFAGILLGAWIDDFTRVSGWTVGVIGVLAVAAFAVDYVAAMLGAKRAGASRLALIGAALGTVLGIFTGLVGLVFMPLLGAALGEYVAQKRARGTSGTGGMGGMGGVVSTGGQVASPGSALAVHHQAARVGLATWLGLLVGTIAKLVLVCLMVGLFVGALIL